MYEVQTTTNAYAGDIPENAWETMSRHKTLAAAIRAKTKLYRQMKRRLSPNSSLCCWDSNRRIIDTKTGDTVYDY